MLVVGETTETASLHESYNETWLWETSQEEVDVVHNDSREGERNLHEGDVYACA